MKSTLSQSEKYGIMKMVKEFAVWASFYPDQVAKPRCTGREYLKQTA